MSLQLFVNDVYLLHDLRLNGGSCMTVGDLIRKLASYNQSLEVKYANCSSETNLEVDIDTVEEVLINKEPAVLLYNSELYE